MGDAPILFRKLIDDAALFPPGNAPMEQAVPGHLQLCGGPHAPLVGPFLCPASRLAELQSTLAACHDRGDGARLAVGLIVDTGTDAVAAAIEAVRADSRLELAMVEVPVPPTDDLAQGTATIVGQVPSEVPLYVELPRRPGWPEALDLLAAHQRGAKFRTGGLTAELFPTATEVAAFIEACRQRAVRFKCTAGLHHAVRHVDPATGFPHHGFLNLLVATARSVTGAPVVDAVAEDRADALTAEAAAIDDELATATRASFASYGSCSVEEPVADLRALGLLPQG